MDAPAGSAPLPLTTTDLDVLDRARKWAKFIAILGAIGVGMTALLVMVMAIVPSRFPIPRAAVGIGGLIVVGLMAAYVSLLFRYVGGIAAHRQGKGAGLARSFRALKLFFIVNAVLQGLSILVTLMLTLGQVLGLVDPTNAGP